MSSSAASDLGLILLYIVKSIFIKKKKERREEQLTCTELYASFQIQLCENYRALIPSKQGVF